MTLLPSVTNSSCPDPTPAKLSPVTERENAIASSGLTAVRAPFEAALLNVGKSGATYDLVQATKYDVSLDREVKDAASAIEKLYRLGIKIPIQTTQVLQVTRLPLPELGVTQRTFVELASSTGIAPMFVRSGRSSGVSEPIGPGAPALMTGMCLFGTKGLFAVEESGTRTSLSDPNARVAGKVVGIEADARLSSYEIESLVRQAQLIRMLAKASTEPPRVFVHIPCEEYMLYAARARLEGRISSRLYAELCGVVSERNTRLAQMMKDKLSGLEVSFVQPLSAARSLIEQPPDDGSESELVRAILARVAMANEAEAIFGPLFRPPSTDLTSIAYRGYVMGYLAAALSVPSRALLAAESAHEERIMTVLDDKRTGIVKEIKARGLCIRSLYRFDSLACLGERTDVALRFVAPPTVRGAFGPTLPPTIINRKLPVMRPLFFSDKDASPELEATLESERS